jgi:multisubunit Na+/H+ antiporter MnhF subunit
MKNIDTTNLEQWVIIMLIIHCIGLCLALYRVFSGPDLSNRLVGLEYVSLNVLSFLALYCFLAADAKYLDIGIVLALISFLSTTALSRYIEREAEKPSEKSEVNNT